MYLVKDLVDRRSSAVRQFVDRLDRLCYETTNIQYCGHPVIICSYVHTIDHSPLAVFIFLRPTYHLQVPADPSLHIRRADSDRIDTVGLC